MNNIIIQEHKIYYSIMDDSFILFITNRDKLLLSELVKRKLMSQDTYYIARFSAVPKEYYKGFINYIIDELKGIKYNRYMEMPETVSYVINNEQLYNFILNNYSEILI